jgi:hypothetical protein
MDGCTSVVVSCRVGVVLCGDRLRIMDPDQSLTTPHHTTPHHPLLNPTQENVGLPDSLLSRFDLLFIVLDQVRFCARRPPTLHTYTQHLISHKK